MNPRLATEFAQIIFAVPKSTINGKAQGRHEREADQQGQDDPLVSPTEGGERVGGTDGVAMAPFAVDLGAGVFGDGIVADQGHRALGCESRQHGGDIPPRQGAEDQRRWEKMR